MYEGKYNSEEVLEKLKKNPRLYAHTIGSNPEDTIYIIFRNGNIYSWVGLTYEPEIIDSIPNTNWNLVLNPRAYTYRPCNVIDEYLLVAEVVDGKYTVRIEDSPLGTTPGDNESLNIIMDLMKNRVGVGDTRYIAYKDLADQIIDDINIMTEFYHSIYNNFVNGLMEPISPGSNKYKLVEFDEEQDTNPELLNYKSY